LNVYVPAAVFVPPEELPPQPVRLLIETSSANPPHNSSLRPRATGSSVSNPSTGSPHASTVRARDDSFSRTFAIVVAAVETVSVVVAAAVPETVTAAGAKLHAAYIGIPVQEKFTAPPNPAAPVTLTFVVTVCPAVTVSVVEPPLPSPIAIGASTVCVRVPLAVRLLVSRL
jgi:hypothetical protein